MSRMVYQEARLQAQRLREGHERGPLPERPFIDDGGLIALTRLANDLGADVEFVPMRWADVSGYIDKEENHPPCIHIDVEEAPTRQRFTLAHEIGHLIDRKGARDDEYSFIDYRTATAGRNLHEFFANEFAGELLMPAREFVAAYQRGGIKEAARAHGVSVPAARARMSRLVCHRPDKDLDLDVSD